MREPLFIVLTGAGGVGKTAVRNALIRKMPGALVTIQKVTTRARRSGEGSEFRFVSPAEFGQMRKRDEFLEATEFGGNSYGTPRKLTEEAWQAGQSVVMIYDVHGARFVRRQHPKRTLWIFLTAPEADLRRRMEARGETPERIAERLRLAPLAETPKEDEADLTVDNADGNLHAALQAIVKAIRSRLG